MIQVVPLSLDFNGVQLEPLLSAHVDGLRAAAHPRRAGTVRDTVMYSILRGEWPEVKAQLHYKLNRT